MDKKHYHIDTLYLSYNCDFLAYKEALQIIAEKPLLYYRDGRHYYDFGYARVGHLDWEICQRSNNYPFVIEYNFNYLYQTDLIFCWQQIKLPFPNDFRTYLVKRMDYNCTFQTRDRTLLESLYVSPYFRKGSEFWGQNREVETIYLGMRKTGKTFRIYNKSKELEDKKNFIKCDMLRNVFGSTVNLYSLEVELLRKYIISRTNIDGSLADFYEIIKLARTLLGSIKYCKNTPKNLALIKSKNYNKIDFKYIDKYLSNIEFAKVKKYDKSKLNLLIAIDRMLEQYNDYDGEVIHPADLGKEIEYIKEKMFVNHKTDFLSLKKP